MSAWTSFPGMLQVYLGACTSAPGCTKPPQMTTCTHGCLMGGFYGKRGHMRLKQLPGNNFLNTMMRGHCTCREAEKSGYKGQRQWLYSSSSRSRDLGEITWQGHFYKTVSPRPGPLNLSTIVILDWIILCCGAGCQAQRTVLCCIPGFYPLDTSNKYPSCSSAVTIKTVSEHSQVAPGGKAAPS